MNVFLLENISVYPTLFTNEFKIENPKNTLLTYTLYNLIGEKIVASESEENKISVSANAAGIYFLHVEAGQRKSIIRLVKAD